jgi:hypothetical protein
VNLRDELLEMVERDAAVAEELARDGSLFAGYHPRMHEVHRVNAARLHDIVAEQGWPTTEIVGEVGAEAAWRIVQHAICEPDFQRAMLRVLQNAPSVERLIAMLEDRIRALEGRPQKYGTQFDWDDRGMLSPYPEIENMDSVDARRAEVGLPPLALDLARRREAVKKSGEPVPKDPEATSGDGRLGALRRVAVVT